MKNTRKIYSVTNDFFKQNGKKIIIFCIVLYIIFFCFIAYLKYISFSYADVDLSIIERQFWNILHGKLIGREIGEPAMFSAGHFFLITLLLIPFYAIYPHPLTLLFLQTIALAIPAYFIYIFAREKIDDSFAFYFALAYLLYPALAFVNLFEFHLIAFVPLFALPMFIFFDKGRFWPFVLFMFLSLACREDVSLVVFGLGVYAFFRYFQFKFPFIKKKSWKWIVVPLLTGALWFIMVTQFIQPFFSSLALESAPALEAPSDSAGMLSFYAWLGRTPAEMLKNIFLHPGQVLRGVFIPPKNRYLLHLFGPLAFLSVFGLKEMVMVFFGLLEGLLSQRPTHFSIHYQYAALLVPFIFISAIFGLRRLLQFNLFKRLRVYILIVLFSISLFSAFKIGPLLKLPFKYWKPDAKDILKEKFVDLVPDKAAVASSFELATRLTHRDKLFFAYHINMADWSEQYAWQAEKYGEKSNCLLLDFQDQLTYFGFYYPNSDINLSNFLKKHNWDVSYEINNIAFFTKAKESPRQLIQTIDNFPELLPGPSFSNGYIKVYGCNLAQQTMLDYSVLHLDAYLECEKPTDTRFALQLDIYSRDDQRLLLRHYFVAADRIYPTKRWKREEKIKISQNVFIPKEIRLEEANLVLNFVRVPDND